MSAKNKDRAGRLPALLKSCRRCGCTEKRACPGGCCWVLETDVCDQCLTISERALVSVASSLRENVLMTESFLRALLLTGGRK